MVQKVGYIGLGFAGGPLASNLFKGDFDVYVTDANFARATEFAEKFKCTAVEPGSDGFKDVDVLYTMLPNGDIVRDVLLGEKGVAKTMKKGTVIADMSTADPFNSMELVKELAELGIDYLDAPITQRRNHLTDIGAVTGIIGCNNDAALEKMLPSYKTMCKYVFPMGKVGAGHVMKAANNYILAASVCALADSFVVGTKFGLDAGQMLEVLNHGSGKVYATEVNLRDEGLTRRYESGFQMGLLVKDVAIEKRITEKMGFQTPLAGVVLDMLSEAMEDVGPSVCHTKMLQTWEKKAGVQLKTTEQPPLYIAPPRD